MSYRIHITKHAEEDIDKAADYIRYTLMNPGAAYDLLVKINEEVTSLTTHPRRNRLVDDPVISSWNVRFTVINNYLAFYVVSEPEKTIHVIRFLYGKRNWIPILKEGISLE